MKRKFIFGLLSLLVFTSNVYAEEKSELFNEIAPNGVLELNSVKPTNQSQLNHFLGVDIAKEYDSMISVYVENCNANLTQCDLNVMASDVLETHTVEVKYSEVNVEMKNLITKYKNSIEATRPSGSGEHYIYYDLSDLSLINYYYHVDGSEDSSDLNAAINYSVDLRKMFGNTNIEYYLNNTAGGADPMYATKFFGTFALMYDGFIYDVIDYLGVKQVPVIYVDDSTDDTDDGYINAAKKRINNYLGGNIASIQVDNSRAYYEGLGYDFSEFGDVSKMSSNVYSVTIGDITRPFVFVKDSSKIMEPEFVNKDLKTNVQISSKSSEVPLDTNVNVLELDKNSSEFKKINEVLKVDLSQSYDLKLYSNTGDNYISKLSGNNLFKVSIPIDESLKSKELVAYYYNEATKEVEEHDITMEGSYVTFTTNHFSIYTIAEKKTNVSEDKLNEEIPPTFDGVTNYVVIGIIGLVGLSISGVFLRKRES